MCIYINQLNKVDMIESTNNAKSNWGWYKYINHQIILDLIEILIW